MQGGVDEAGVEALSDFAEDHVQWLRLSQYEIVLSRCREISSVTRPGRIEAALRQMRFPWSSRAH